MRPAHGAAVCLAGAALLGLLAGGARADPTRPGPAPAATADPTLALENLSRETSSTSAAPAPDDLSHATSRPPPRMPGPARAGGRPDAPARNRRCEACHPEIAAEWRASLHHRAATEPSYLRALRREPSAFCRGCHAPEGDPDAPSRAARELGVGCVTCHAPEGEVLAAPSTLSRETSPHPLLRAPEFAGTAACGGCHEFAFPAASALMQATLREHAASAFAAVSCAGCHMPTAGGARPHRSHRFAASRDPEALRRALRAAAERRPGGQVRLTLEPGIVGHAFPTGDLFRRLVVRAEVVGGRGADQRVLARHFGRDTRTELADDRVGVGGPRVVALGLGAAAEGRPIRWSIRYERVAFPRDARAAAELDGVTEVSAGVLPP